MNRNTSSPGEKRISSAFEELEGSLYLALQHYANVHRGSGHASQVTTALYEEARKIVLETLGLSGKEYRVIFCSPRSADWIRQQLDSRDTFFLSSRDIGLPLGVRALILPKGKRPRKAAVQTGGGTARLVGPNWVIWAKEPERYEAGTPAIINVIAFARALQLLKRHGQDAFKNKEAESESVAKLLQQDEPDLLDAHDPFAMLRRTCIGVGIGVPTYDGNRPFINFDHAASTPSFEAIWRAARGALRLSGTIPRDMVSEVRTICSTFLNAPEDQYEVVFTTNTTEAINCVARSLAREGEGLGNTMVLNTMLEHNSNELPWRYTPGLSVIRMPVSETGFLDLSLLDSILADYNKRNIYGDRRIGLLAVSGASNVLGTCNDLGAIGKLTRRYGVRLLVDGAQLVAHRPVDLNAWGVDYLVFSGHKIYAPFGTGVLIGRRQWLSGAKVKHPEFNADGEENLFGIAALGKSLRLLQQIGMERIQAREQALTKHALEGMTVIPGIRLYGIKDPDSPDMLHRTAVIAFDFKSPFSGRVARELAERGAIGVRFGCHCAHLLIKYLLHVPSWGERLQGLMVRLIPGIDLPGVVRVSLGIENGEEEIGELLRILSDIAAKRPSGGRGGRKFKEMMDAYVKDLVQAVYDVTDREETV